MRLADASGPGDSHQERRLRMLEARQQVPGDFAHQAASLFIVVRIGHRCFIEQFGNAAQPLHVSTPRAR